MSIRTWSSIVTCVGDFVPGRIAAAAVRYAQVIATVLDADECQQVAAFVAHGAADGIAAYDLLPAAKDFAILLPPLCD